MEPDPSTLEQKNPLLSQTRESEEHWLVGSPILSLFEDPPSFLDEYAFECQKLAKEITLKEEAVRKQTLELRKKEEELVKAFEEREKKDKEIKLKEDSVRKYGLELKMKEEELQKVLKKESVMKHTLELRKKEEELMKAIDEREKKVEFLEVSVTKRLGVLEEKDREIKLKQESVKKQTLELKMKEEELVKAVEEREKKVEFLEVSVTKRLGVLEEKEKESDLKQIQEAEMIRLILEKQNEEVVTQHKAQEKLLHEDSIIKKQEEVMVELKAVKEEMCLLSKSVDEKSCELERKVKEFEMKQVLEIESRRKEAELMKKYRKKLESRENELNEAIAERLCELKKKEDMFELEKEEEMCELEKKEDMFELKKREETRKIEEKSKLLDLKEKKLEEREIQLTVKMNEIKERLQKARAHKRSRHEAGTSSLAHNDRNSDSVIAPRKRHKHNRDDEERVRVVRGKARYDSASEQTEDTGRAKTRHDPTYERKGKAKTMEVEEVVWIDSDDEEDPEPITCPDPEFHCFTNTMESFSVGQIWAIYEPQHLMPRYYGMIKRILQQDLSLRVEWLEPEQETTDENTIVCGDFICGEPDTQSYMAFSHKMHYIKQGKTITIYPRKGETWAVFSDGNSQREHGEYKFVEVVTEFSSHGGINVALLESVEGFRWVYQRNPLSQMLIPADEMNRFSHNIPSIKLTGAEKEGVPPGSFELDPAAIPKAYLKV